MAHDWAMKNKVSVIKFPADWKTHGRAAGPTRNRQMLQEGDPDLIVAFPKTILEASRGTRNMVEQARKLGLPVIVDERI